MKQNTRSRTSSLLAIMFAVIITICFMIPTHASAASTKLDCRNKNVHEYTAYVAGGVVFSRTATITITNTGNNIIFVTPKKFGGSGSFTTTTKVLCPGSSVTFKVTANARTALAVDFIFDGNYSGTYITSNVSSEYCTLSASYR